MVYISDNEPYPVHPKVSQDTDSPDESVFIEDGNQRLINFVKDVDYLIHDAQYTPEEYQTKVQWGHSPYDYTVKIHDDTFVDTIIEAAKKISWQTGSNMQILGAQEGLELSLD